MMESIDLCKECTVSDDYDPGDPDCFTCSDCACYTCLCWSVSANGVI